MLQIDHAIGLGKLTTGEWALPLMWPLQVDDFTTFDKWRAQHEISESECRLGEYSVASMFGDTFHNAIIGRSENLKTLALLTFP